MSARRFWRPWTLVTCLAHVAGAPFWLWPAALLVQGPHSAERPDTTLTVYALMVIAAVAHGGLLGAAQGLVLRDRLEIPKRTWTLATTIGVVAGWAAMAVFAPSGDAGPGADLAAIAIGGLAFGLLVGAAQWIVMASDGIAPMPWIAASAVAWSGSFTLTAAALGAAPAGLFFVAAVGSTVIASGALVGAITGLVLGHLLR